MKVLICNKFYRPFGGPETMVRDTTRMLEAHGHEVIPFAMDHPDNWPSEWSRFFVSQKDYHAEHGLSSQIREAINVIYNREARRQMEALLNEVRPDIVHAHNIYHQLSPSIFGPIKKRGIPIVLTVHDYKLACPGLGFTVDAKICERCAGGKFYNAIIHKCVFGSRAKSAVCMVENYLHRFLKVYQRSADVIVSPSQFLIDALRRCGAGAERMVRVPNIADVEMFTPTYENDGYILYFGKLTPEKGVKTLIRAIGAVPSARLVAAGTGPQAEELKALAEEVASGRVEFAGFLTGDKLRRAIERCMFFVIPSESYENCPCTILESYSAGKPVVGSRIGGIPELIDDGVDGVLYEPGNLEELTEKIGSMVGDPGRLVEMGRAGRERMERKYSRQEHYRQLMEVYESVLRVEG